MNNVVLMGRLVREPRSTVANGANGDLEIARFTLAVDRRFKRDEQSADFIGCVAFGKTAEFVNKYLHQGTKIALSGRIQTGSYNKADGTKVYTTDVIAENIEFAESKNTQSAGVPGEGDFQADDDPEGFMRIPDGMQDEGLPFN